MPDLDPAVRELLEGANFVSLATLTRDGSPHGTVVWAAVEDGRPCFFTQPQSFKAKNIAGDGRVAVTVVDRENPYRSGQLRGTVSATAEGDEASRSSTGWRASTPAPTSRCAGVVYLIEVSSSRLTELPFADAWAEPPPSRRLGRLLTSRGCPREDCKKVG